MKRIISLLLVLSMLFSFLPTIALAFPTENASAEELANPFTDVKEDDWFFEAVQYARINGFFNGVSETKFDPSGTMTRGMFVTVLGRMAGVDTADYEGQTPFKDVPANTYYAPYVAWAAKHGITTGSGDGTFSPDALINREQMATFFVRYFENFDVNYETGKNITAIPFDIDEVSPWAVHAVERLWREGLLNGDGKNFNPDSAATRAQTATIAQRTDEVVETWYKEPGVPSDRVRISLEAAEEAEDVSNEDFSAPSNSVIVNFFDGDRLIESFIAEKDEPLGKVPSVKKSSKANAILVGYFVDPEFTQPFYAEEPVTGNMSVYAKYEEMGSTEELNFTSFAQMDQAPDVKFEVVGTGNPETDVTLEVKDGSNPVALSFEETDTGYIVSAVDGFNEGASYQLHLADGWTFKDKPETVRTSSFSIAMEEVQNLKMNDAIKYIQDTDDIDYTIDARFYDVLTQSLISENGGSFTYDGNDLEVGDIICLYVGTHPNEREDSDLLDPAVYVKVEYVGDSTVDFLPLGEEDQKELYKVPDNFLIKVEALPSEREGTVNISALDIDAFLMMGEYTRENAIEEAKALAEPGDFITLYISQDSIKGEEDIYYGEITAYNVETGEITYKQISKETILSSMDLYANVNLEGDDFVTEEEVEELERTLLLQVEKSGFAEDAAFMLADMVTKTDGFKSSKGIQDFIIKGTDGKELTTGQLELLNLGRGFELTDDIKLTVELITRGEQLHFEGGVQLAIGIEAEFEVELESEDKINIELSATFVQEVMISPKVKGEIVFYELFGFIPIPNGVKVGATIDIKNFTAFSFEATIYTVEADDELGWDSFKEKANKFIEDAGIQIPDELIEGAKTIKDLADKAKELEAQARELQDDYTKYTKYMRDANTIWSAIEENGLSSKEDWLKLEETFGATSISSDLLNMMNLTTETGLSTEYYDSLQALMDRYAEMLEQESDWITLVEQKMFMVEINVLGLVLGVDATFVVRADMSLAIGSNIEYEVGKRYEFWFKIGLFKPSAGSSTMDLLDERFAFQFYVMGRLGIKAGVRAKIYVAIGTGDLASVGIYAELGPYAKLYGFFVYENTKYRAKNTNNWIKTERMMGALYFEFGLYFIMGFEAEALGLFEYSYEFLDEEIPLLNAGTRKYYYQFDYEPEEEEIVLVKDHDLNSTNGITMTLPENLIALKAIDLKSGAMNVEALDYNNYNFTVSNPNFSINRETGEISVTVPENVRYMECTLTATYKYSKAAFSTYDMTVSIPLVWTNMAADDLTQYYTASVRVGNNEDGFETVWTKRILKNKEFDLPVFDDTEDEDAKDIKALIDWNDYKHELLAGYGEQQTEGLSIIEDTAYDFNIGYKTYSITVTGVQNADGTTEDRTYYAKYGEAFDFSDLKETGIVNYADGIFTAFTSLTTEATIGEGDKEKPFDLTRAIDTRMAEALIEGVTAVPEYIDNSVTATFSFTGLDYEDIQMTVRRGDEPSLNEVAEIVSYYGLALKDIFPDVAPMTANTTYKVVCGDIIGPSTTVSFEENGGSEVENITKVVGSLVGTLPSTERTGYTFGGWFTDESFTERFSERKMQDHDITLYAKWTANNYTVTFHVNGGDSLATADATKTVSYDSAYGALPSPARTNYGFIGWFTAAEGGEQVFAEDIYTLTNSQTLYAQWRYLKPIPKSVFDFGDVETATYEYDTYYTAEYSYNPEADEAYKLSDFTIEYLGEGYEDEGYLTEVMEAGTYGVRISRPADDYYAKFEYFYSGVLSIAKATRDLDGISIKQSDNGFTYIELQLNSEIFDLDEDAKIKYSFGSIWPILNRFVSTASSKKVDSEQPVKIYNLYPGDLYSVLKISVSGERNYEDSSIILKNCDYETLDIPSTNWLDDSSYYYADTYWYNTYDTVFYIDTADELAGLAKLVNEGTDDFAGKTIKLRRNVELYEHTWVPIGTPNNQFRGTFDGQGYTISGVCFSNGSKGNVGLFGDVAGELVYEVDTSSIIPVFIYSLKSQPVIKNVVLDDSYFYGKYNVGGIAGLASNGTTIDNCTNYAVVTAYQLSEDNDWRSSTGGIVGCLGLATVVNCVNYGKVVSEGRLTGGIVGYAFGLMSGRNFLLNTRVINNANFGSVTGSSRIGGVAGCTESGAYVKNNYNCGTVYSNNESDAYIGAVVGRNYEDDGVVEYNYYLKDCAYGDDGDSRNALGTDGGSRPDGWEHKNGYYYASSFTSPSSILKSSAGEYGEGGCLIDALNAWVQAEGSSDNAAKWTAADENSYPLSIGTYTSAIR